MRHCSQHWLDRRCREAGGKNGDCDGCIVSRGEALTVDETHPSFPKTAAQSLAQKAASAPPAHASGPGTELKKLLRLVGITATPTCPCNARAAQMDAWGPDECERRLDEIVDWLGEEAQRRRLPFVRFAAQKVVKLAIRRARAGAASRPGGDITLSEGSA